MAANSDVAAELLEIADRVDKLAENAQSEAIQKPLEALEKATEEIEKSWSGSWLGYHANVYYRDLQPTPPGAHFSQEWGLKPTSFVRETRGD